MKHLKKLINCPLTLYYKILILLVSCFINGCSLFHRGTLLKHYKSAGYIDCDKDSTNDICKGREFVKMGLFSSTEIGEEERETAKTIWNLLGEGQAALIEKLNQRYKENDTFKKELDNKYIKVEESYDFTVKKVRLVISTKKLIDNNPKSATYSLADRIQNLKFKITFKDTGVTFLKWNKFTTEFGEIDLGDITYERNAEATLGAGSDETVAKAEIKGGVTRSEEVKLRRNYAKLNGMFSKDSLVVYLQGTREIDLDGNITIEATLKFKEKKGYFIDMGNLKKLKGNYLHFDSVQPSFQVKLVPEYTETKPLTISFDYHYSYRHVIKNANTYDESDDKVTFIDGSGQDNSVILLNNNEIFPDRYSIFSDDSIPLELHNPDILNVKNSHESYKVECASKPSDIPLWFCSEEQAAEFYGCLRYWGKMNPSDETIIRIGCYELRWAGNPFTYHTAHIFDFAEIRKL